MQKTEQGLGKLNFRLSGFFVDDIQIIPENDSKSIRVLLPEYLGVGKLRIFDLAGRIVKSCELGGHDSKIATSDLRDGIYLVEVQSGKLKKTEKVLLSPSQAE